jgi:nitronate monooxygenase
MSDAAPAFPYAATLIVPLRAASERAGSVDYMQIWAGQAARLAKSLPAAEFTRNLAADVLSYWYERFGL